MELSNINSLLFPIYICSIAISLISIGLSIQAFRRSLNTKRLVSVLLMQLSLIALTASQYITLTPDNSFHIQSWMVASALLMVSASAFYHVFSTTKQIEYIQRKLAQESYQAQHDPLTGLPNRDYGFQKLKEYVRKNTPFSLTLIDLDNFKQINDVIGHYYGDQLLVQVADRLLDSFARTSESPSFIARMGGDEFLIVTDFDDQSSLVEQSRCLNRVFEPAYEIENFVLNIRFSSGTSLFLHDNTPIEKLLQQADVAMYAAKHAGVDHRLYNTSLDQHALQSLQISSRLISAIQKWEFEIYYQPIIDTNTSDLHGYEALIRWPQTDGQFISPQQFIPIAEKSNNISKITHNLIQQVTEDINKLTTRTFKPKIHINLSVRDLLGNSLLSQLSELVCNRTLQPDQLVLEITESMMMTDLANCKLKMLQLTDLGFEISLDDFGTGYSSFYSLKDLPISQIKADSSFVMDMLNKPADKAIVESTLYLGERLGLSVVAEGVMSQEHAEVLANMNCQFLQGDFFSHPLSLDNALSWSQNYRKSLKLAFTV